MIDPVLADSLVGDRVLDRLGVSWQLLLHGWVDETSPERGAYVSSPTLSERGPFRLLSAPTPTSEMDDAERAAITARLERASGAAPGEWLDVEEADYGRDGQSLAWREIRAEGSSRTLAQLRFEDRDIATFIASAPGDIRALLREIARLRDES